MVIRQALCLLLEQDGFCQVVGQALTGREAVELAGKLKPDIVLMDIAMPLLSGLGATRQILAAQPSAKVLILSGHSDESNVERLTAAGARGFMEKQSSAEILMDAIQDVMAGKSFFSPAIVKRRAALQGRTLTRDGLFRPGGMQLTSRELEVLQLVAEGQGNKQSARILRISVKTVAKHRQQLMDKLNIHETAGLTRYAMVHGIVESRVHVAII